MAVAVQLYEGDHFHSPEEDCSDEDDMDWYSKQEEDADDAVILPSTSSYKFTSRKQGMLSSLGSSSVSSPEDVLVLSLQFRGCSNPQSQVQRMF